MNQTIVSCLWQATLRLQTSVITALKSDPHILIWLGYGLEGESHVCR